MEELIKLVIEQSPTFIGLLLLAFVLYRQNERLLDNLFDEIDNLASEVDLMRKDIEELRKSR